MEYDRFDEPVGVFVGMGYLAQIETVGRAYELLADMPDYQRGPGHTMAMNVCKAALAKEVDAETARAAFVRYAQSKGILAPEIKPVIAARETGIVGSRLTQ
jgi:hypothetical protein